MNKKRKRMTKMAWVLVALVFIMLALLWRSSPSTNKVEVISPVPTVSPVPTIKTTEAEPILSEVEAKEAFMEGCTESGNVSWKVCNCMYTEIRKDYSILEMVALIQLEDKGLLEILSPYIFSCID